MNAPQSLKLGVLKKLQSARVELNAMAIKKGARNEFAKYNYMELGDFLIPVQGIFAKLGLVGTVSFGVELATLTITDTDDGSTVDFTSPMSTAELKGCHPVQNLGAVQTYLRRYLWVAALEIVEHDAIDSAEPIKEPTAGEISAAITTLKAVAEDGMTALNKALKAIPEEVKARIDPETKKSIASRAKEVSK